MEGGIYEIVSMETALHYTIVIYYFVILEGSCGRARKAFYERHYRS